jgi:Fuc2NAc and GlcNAc transferase
LSFYIAFIVVVLAFQQVLDLRANWVLPLLVGGSIITLVGFLDDLIGLSAAVRLLAQLVTAAVSMVILSDFGRTDVAVSFLPQAPAWLVYVFCFLFMMWMINLYNFMDGVDGMAATQAVVVASLSAGLCYWQGNQPLFYLYALVAATAIGFLIFNWSPAKIFMGDSGAYFLGFAFACLALMSKIYSRESFFSHLILLGVFITDATYTLMIRAWRRERLHAGHRTHGFQHIVRRGWSHAQVTLLFNFITVAWLGPLSVLAVLYTDYASRIFLLAYAPLLALMVFLRAGVEREYPLKGKGMKPQEAQSSALHRESTPVAAQSPEEIQA